MKAFDQTSVLKELCKATQKWGLYINIDIPEGIDVLETLQACSFLDPDNDEHAQIIFEECGYFLFDTEKEMERHFGMCVGDDGPTELNKYDGKVSVYALTCSPVVGLLSSNT